jgi:NTP pyrophosphatase (non-canonical NTP hydrolase)
MTLLEQIDAEMARAIKKFPTWPTDPLHALAVLGEEYGELTQAVLQHTYEPHKSTREDVRKEAVQVAAMALRFLDSLDRYKYARGPQHEQGGAK